MTTKMNPTEQNHRRMASNGDRPLSAEHAQPAREQTAQTVAAMGAWRSRARRTFIAQIALHLGCWA